MSSRSDEYTLREVEAHVRILQNSHVGLLQEMTKIRQRLAEVEARNATEDVRVLRSDVNQIMEHRQVSAALHEQAAARSDRLAARLETVEQTIIADAVAPGVPVSEGSRHSHRSRDRPAKKKKVKVESDSSSSSSSEDEPHPEGSSPDSSDAENERSRHRASRSRATEVTQSAARGRTKGRRHLGLKELKPTNLLYRKLLSYRYYRLEDTTPQRTPRGTGKVRNHLRQMELTMKAHKFSGEDPILVLDFLSRFVAEADILRMSEAQAYIALPYFLTGLAEDQFNSVRGSTRASEGGVTCWPEAVQYLLRSYATGNAIQGAILALRDTKQKADESETVYSTRLNKAFHRCGNVFSAAERCTMFVDGLTRTIGGLVARYRENNRRVSYLELVQFAQAEGDAVRARAGIGSRPRRLLHVEARDVPLSHSRGSAQGGYDNVHLLQGDESLPSSELPSTTEPSATDVDPALYAGRQVPALPVPHSSGYRAQRPGWRDPFPPRQERRPANPELLRQLICHTCYRHGHIAPNCLLPVRDMAMIVSHYESLTPAERERVPEKSYLRAKADTQPERQHAAPPLGGNVAAPAELPPPQTGGEAQKN